MSVAIMLFVLGSGSHGARTSVCKQPHLRVPPCGDNRPTLNAAHKLILGLKSMMQTNNHA